jgi:putative polyhydroxyalkanoate system protein
MKRWGQLARIETCTMQKLTASIPHRLTREEARRRIQGEIAKLRQQHGHLLHGVNESWSGDRLDFSLSAMGQSVAGNLLVGDHAVDIEVELPWLLALLAGPVKQRVEREGRVLLSGPAKT